MATMKTMATVYSYENTNAMTYSITIKKNWNDAHNNKQLTMHNKYTNDDVDFDDCVAHDMLTVSVDGTHRTLMAQVMSAFTLHPWSSTWRTLLDSPLHFLLLPLPPVCHRLPLPPRAVP